MGVSEQICILFSIIPEKKIVQKRYSRLFVILWKKLTVMNEEQYTFGAD